MWRSPNCVDCCSGTPSRNVLPDVLEVSASFSGVSFTGSFLPVTFTLERCCSTCFVRQAEVIVDGEDIGPLTVSVEHKSRPVDLGPLCGPGVFALGPFYSGNGFGVLTSETVLWLRIGESAIAFRLHDGAPLIKKTSAISACTPQLSIVLVNGVGSPLLQITPAITDSWASIAAQIVSGGLATECSAVWVESLANGWDLATLLPILANATYSLVISSQNASACDPTDFNTVFALNHNSRYVGGEAKFSRLYPTSAASQDAAYSSNYGLSSTLR